MKRQGEGERGSREGETKRERQTDRQTTLRTVTPVNAVPIGVPFLKKLRVRSPLFRSAPITSPAPKHGPYACPMPLPWKACPSSPWYP